jgi:hypothetical protein
MLKAGAFALIILVFVVSRIVFYQLIIRYWGFNEAYPQALSITMLTLHLLQSLWYQHTVPPLLNLVAGLTLKWFPLDHPDVQHRLWMALGLLGSVGLLSLLIDLELPLWLATLVTLVYMVSPEYVLFENWFYVTCPSMCLMILAAASLARYLRTGRKSWGVAFLLFLAAPITLNATFQIEWFIAIIAGLYYLAPSRFRRLRTVAVAITLAVSILYFKNLILFGTFTTSSYFGMNLATMSTMHEDFGERERLVKDGTLSRFALLDVWAPLKDYGPDVLMPHTGVLALDAVTKDDGSPNMNNLAYIAISRAFGRDARWVILHRPLVYLRSLLTTVVATLEPGGDYGLVEPNRVRIPRWNALYEWPLLTRQAGNVRMSFLFLIGFPALWIISAQWLRMHGGASEFDVDELMIALMLACILYVTAVVVVLNSVENDRARAPIDPYYLVLTVFFGYRLVRWLRSRSSG